MVLTAAIICCSLVNILKFAGFRSKFDFPTSKHLYILSIGKLLKFEHRSRLGWPKVCYIFNFACFLYIYIYIYMVVFAMSDHSDVMLRLCALCILILFVMEIKC